jgi:hypothetical protein
MLHNNQGVGSGNRPSLMNKLQAIQVDNRIKVNQYKKVGYEDDKTWMERRLANMNSGVPNWAAVDLASQWCNGLKWHDLDETIAEIESINLANQYNQWHVLRLGSISQKCPGRVFQILEGQLNSASSLEARLHKTGDIIRLIKEWEIQGGAISEVGVNWGTYPSSANLASWFWEDIQDMHTHTAHNKHEGVAHHQPGGTATFVCMELIRYHKQKDDDFRGVGWWCLTVFYADPSHPTCIISAYNVGRHAPRGDSMIYQQQLKYIQNHGLDSTSSHLFTVDFVAQLQVWQCQGDRLLVFMDMNEHILTGCIARRLLSMGLRKATHSQWGEMEPYTYVHGSGPINAVWHSQDLEFMSTLQLSFHEGVGDHRLVLVDIIAQSAIGKQEIKVVHPHRKRLSS